MAKWEPPEVEVVFVRQAGTATLVGLALPTGLRPPLFPASLVSDGEQVLHLDAHVGSEGDSRVITVARTEEIPTEDLEGLTFGFQQWWMPKAFDAVVDLTRLWMREVAPAPSDHEHCLLDSITIGDGGEETGWRSGDDWVCCTCYRRYFVKDHLGLRQG